MINIKKNINYSKDSILSRKIAEEITLFSMATGTEISNHTSTKKAFVYVIEGKGIFNLEGKDIEMEEGVFISIDKNQVHSLKAEENMSFILFLMD